jgi:hypothetical protein
MKGVLGSESRDETFDIGDVTTIELQLCGWSFEGSFALYCIDLT